MKRILIGIICLGSLSLSAQIVSTQFGQVEGTTNGSIKQFLGIPFAKPPVGDLRWKAPQNPDNWAGTILTQSFAPVCPQKNFQQGGKSSTITGDEDCLYLNIWTPQISNTANLPVMIFIHGGGNQQGSASEVNGGTQMYFGKNLAERGNVVVVTIQYRLGPLGFLVHPGLDSENENNVSGNYAILDQILALQWVQDNISNFGGDINKVMIFGESAGGLNVGNLLTTPLANGLFQRAAIESATPVIGNYDTIRNKGITYVNTFTNTGTDLQKIAYMRSLPADTLVKDEEPPINGGAVGMNWQAVIDSVVFFDYPVNKFQTGNFNHVPLIVGSNSDEMSLSAPSTVYPFMVSALINTLPAEYRTQATSIYPPGASMDTIQAKKSYIGFLTDAQFTATTRRVAQCVSQNQTEPVYRYFFTHKHTVAAIADKGSYHGMELFYVFNTWENATLGSGVLFKPADDSTQQAMLKYWTNFANTGNPNGGTLPVWQKYNNTTDCYLEIKATPNSAQCGLRTTESNFWDTIAGYTGCTPLVGPEETGTIKSAYFMCYPNPATDWLELMLPEEIHEFDIIIYNQMGQIVKTSKNNRQIDVTNLNNGIYFIETKAKSYTLKTKIIKM